MAGALGERDRQRFQALGVHLLPPDGALDALGQLGRHCLTERLHDSLYGILL